MNPMKRTQPHPERRASQGPAASRGGVTRCSCHIPAYVIALLLGMLLAEAAWSQSWTSLSSGTTERLNHIENGSFSDCWIVGDGGFVATSVGCTAFSPVDVNAGSTELIASRRPASENVWVGGESGVVRHRLHAGGDWSVLDIPGASATEKFFLFSRSTDDIRAVGDQGSVFRNLTGTPTGWELEYTAAEPLHGGHGSVTATAHVVGDGGLILETPDGGLSWITRPSGTTADLFAIIPGPFGSLLVVGDQGTILKSTDDGVTWHSKPSNTTAALRWVSTSGQNTSFMLAAGDDGVILRSVDGGESWCFLHATLSDLRGVEMVSNGVALVVGEGGLILRTDDGGGDCQPEPQGLFGDGFESGGCSAWSTAQRPCQ